MTNSLRPSNTAYHTNLGANEGRRTKMINGRVITISSIPLKATKAKRLVKEAGQPLRGPFDHLKW